MKDLTLPRRAAWAVLFAVGTLAALAGCSRKLASVDAGRTTLEGRPDANAQLLAWYDTPDTVLYYLDNSPPGPDLPSAEQRVDVLLGGQPVYRTGPGTVNMILLDHTAASGFQFYRRSNSGALQPISDYTILPSMKWLPLEWDLYSLVDKSPSAYSPTTYVARGLLDGRVTTISPLSNEAIASGPAPTASINVRYVPATRTERDSAITWTTVPGAAAYWLDVYQFKNTAAPAEVNLSGPPTPVLAGSVSHLVVGRFADDGSAQMRYTLGSQIPGLIAFANLLPAREYFARVTAVDANGRVLAWNRSRTQDEDPFRDDWVLRQGAGYYWFYPLGAIRVPSPNHNF